MQVPLRTTDYDRVARAGFLRLGIPGHHADAILRARWPLRGCRAVLAELHARGWECDKSDLVAYFEEACPDEAETEWDADIEDVLWYPLLLDHVLAWLVATHRGCLTPRGEQMLAQPDQVKLLMRAAHPEAN